MAKKTPLEILHEKLAAFQQEMAITADPSLKFELGQRIQEIESQIAEQQHRPSDSPRHNGEAFRPFVTKFRDAERRAQFKYLTAYKQLHLTLHDLQSQQQRIAEAADRRQAAGEKLPEDLGLALRAWRSDVEKWVKATELKGKDEQGDWLKPFYETVDLLLGADASAARKAAVRLLRLPNLAHGMLNAELVKCSLRLKVDELIDLLQPALDAMNGAPLEAPALGLKAAAAEFIDSSRAFRRVISTHDRCQKIDDGLRQVRGLKQGVLAADLGGWSEILDWLDELNTLAPGDFRVLRTHAAGKTYAEATTVEAARSAYLEFDTRFGDLFKEADKQVLAETSNLLLAAESLNDALREVLP